MTGVKDAPQEDNNEKEQQEIDALTAKVEALLNEISSAKQEIESLKENITTLKSENGEL